MMEQFSIFLAGILLVQHKKAKELCDWLNTYIGLKHGVVLFFGAETLLEHSNVLLVVLVLLLKGLATGEDLSVLLSGFSGGCQASSDVICRLSDS
jgi:hypothetical protein